MRKTSLKKQKANWLEWLAAYGAEKFLTRFLQTVEGARGTCIHCHNYIYVDLLLGGGLADWSTRGGDFVCDDSPNGNHLPSKRGIR